MKTLIRTIVEKVNIQSSTSGGTVTARSAAKQPRTVVVKVPGPQGPAGTAALGTVTVLDPDDNPTVTATGTARDRIFNFSLPRAAAFAVGSVEAGVDAADASVVDVGVNGDVELDFTLPRSNFTIGTVTEITPDSTPAVTATVTSGDVALNFDLPAAPEVTVAAATVLNPDQNPSVSSATTDGDVEVTFSIPRGPSFTVGTITVGNDATDADVTDVGTNGDIELDLKLPRTTLAVGTTTPLNPNQNPVVANSGTDAAAVFDFDLPRAPTFTVGTVTTVNPDVPAAVTDVGTNGDIVLNIDIPQGNTGDPGAGLPPTSGADEGKTIFVTSTGSTELRIPSTTDVTEGTNLYYTDGRVEAVIAASDTDDLSEGVTNLYYTDTRADARIAAASVFDLSDMDEGSGFSDGDILVYDAIGGVWIPDRPDIDYVPLEYISAGFSGGDIIVDVDNGAQFSFSHVMAGSETLTAPQNMPEGSVANLFIDAINTDTNAPVVQSRESGRTIGDATSHPITLPSGVTTGDLILAFFSVDGIPTVTTASTGWNKLGQSSNGSIVTGAAFWKIATGSDSLTLTTSASEESSHVTLRISGVRFPAAIVSASSNGSSTNSNPAAATTSATDSRGRLWVASRSGDSTVVATVAPSGYSNLQTQAANTVNGASTNTAEITTSGTTATEDPGTFTSASEQWVCWTVGVDSTGSFTLSYGVEFLEQPIITGKTLLQLVRLPNSEYLALEAWSV